MAETKKVKGVTIPEQPLNLRRLVLPGPGGKTPDGSNGWVHISTVKGGRTPTAIVSSAAHTGRFWDAAYDPERNVWVATSAGRQYKSGRVIETFPMPSSSMGITDTPRGRRDRFGRVKTASKKDIGVPPGGLYGPMRQKFRI